MDSLPDDFKKRFPSMRELYTQLSDDIHQANGPKILFEEVKEKINEHFKARELYKI